MKKLLFTLLTISPVVPVVSLLAVNPDNIVEKNNKMSKEAIDLSKIESLPLEMNLNQYDDLISEDEIRDIVLTELIYINKANEVLVDVLYDIMFEPQNWKITGINFEKPEIDEYNVYHARFMSSDREKYKGVLAIDITLFNKKEKADLNNVIKEKKLGEIVNPTETLILEALYDKNNVLDISQLKISEITYESATISAKSSSTLYTGTVYIEFVSKIDFQIDEWDSGILIAEAYNSTQTKHAEHTYTYDMEFGSKAFQNTFSTISIEYSGYWKTTGLAEDWTETYEHKIVSFEIGEEKNLWDQKYQGSVNWNSSKAFIDTRIQGDKIEIEFDLTVEAYASWMNAYWSRAYGSLEAHTISFS